MSELTDRETQGLIDRNHEAFESEWVDANMPNDPILKLRCESFFVRGIRIHAERETAALAAISEG